MPMFILSLSTLIGIALVSGIGLAYAGMCAERMGGSTGYRVHAKDFGVGFLVGFVMAIPFVIVLVLEQWLGVK